MHSVLEKFKYELDNAENIYNKKKSSFNFNELLFNEMDQRPCREDEVSINTYMYLSGNIDIDIYYETLSIPILIPVLEFFEDMFQKEFKSYDDDAGNRHFKLDISEEFGIILQLIVTPQDNIEATCRKVLVGESTETFTNKKPIYKIVCE